MTPAMVVALYVLVALAVGRYVGRRCYYGLDGYDRDSLSTSIHWALMASVLWPFTFAIVAGVDICDRISAAKAGRVLFGRDPEGDA